MSLSISLLLMHDAVELVMLAVTDHLQLQAAVASGPSSAPTAERNAAGGMGAIFGSTAHVP
jgi:hypothetical protein